MRTICAILVALGALFWVTTHADAGSRCPRCNIVDEGLLGRSLIGSYVYEQDSTGKFYRVVVENVSMSPPAINRRILTGEVAWNTASAFYSEASMNEIVLAARGGSPAYRETDVDRQHRSGVLASCAAYLGAKKDNNFGLAFIMERGCCQSSWSKQYAPPGVCAG